MAKKMVFPSSKGTQIIFDDFTDNTKEYDSYWAQMCQSCYEKYKSILGNRCDDAACGICSVEGCENEAEYYVDFSSNEVHFQNDDIIDSQ